MQTRGLGAGGRNARDRNDGAPSERQRPGIATPMAPSVNASLSAAVVGWIHSVAGGRRRTPTFGGYPTCGPEVACRPPEPPPACFSRRRLKHGCEHSFDRPTIYRASEAHNDGNKGLGVGGSVLTSARVTGTGFTRARLLRSSRVPGKGGELTKAGHALQKTQWPYRQQVQVSKRR